MTTKFYVDGNGKYLGGFEGAQPPAGAVEVNSPPQHASQVWNGSSFGSKPVSINDVDEFLAERLANGYADAVTGKTYQCDQASIGKWTAIGSSAGLAVLAQTNPLPVYRIIAKDNSITTLSAVDAYTLMNVRIMPWVSETILFARQVKNNILSGNPPQDVSIGWP